MNIEISLFIMLISDLVDLIALLMADYTIVALCLLSTFLFTLVSFIIVPVRVVAFILTLQCIVFTSPSSFKLSVCLICCC